MAKGGNTVKIVWDIVEPLAKELGLSIWDVRFLKEGSQWYLRVFIDKDGGGGIDDCVNLSHAIDGPIDEANPIEQAYILEVSSPGVERELTKDEHFVKFIGSPVMLRAIRPINNVRDFNGTLTDYQDKKITVKLQDGEELVQDKKETSYVKLDDFNIDDFKQEL